MPTASIKFTADFLIVASQRYRRQHRRRYIVLATQVIVIALLVPIAAWIFWKGHIVLGLFPIAISTLVFFIHHVQYWLIRRRFAKSPYRDEEIRMEFDDTGFHARSPKQDVRLQWTVFTKVVHFKDGFLLFQGPNFFNWIPLSSLIDGSQVAEMETLLRSKIAEHRIFEAHSPQRGL